VTLVGSLRRVWLWGRYAARMIRRALAVLLPALAMECATAASFTDTPNAGQLALLVAAFVLMVMTPTLVKKKLLLPHVLR
jgi:hypothetical protein